MSAPTPLKFRVFTFNPFQENTYVVSAPDGECWIFDPGCYTKPEREALVNYFEKENLKPSKILLTHAHIDHVLGVKFLSEKYGIPMFMHEGEIPVLDRLQTVAQTYGIQKVDECPAPSGFINEGDILTLGGHDISLLLAPGHSPASICFYFENMKCLIAGDVLFQESIGRTDLPGGNHAKLLESIRTKLYKLPEETKVFPGHGGATSIGHEMEHNPYVRP